MNRVMAALINIPQVKYSTVMMIEFIWWMYRTFL